MKKITLFVFLFLSLTIYAQNIIEKEISGIVTYDNTPLANVTILIKNLKKVQVQILKVFIKYLLKREIFFSLPT